MLKLVGILAQTPSHDTTKVLSVNNITELAGNEVGSIPSPEKVDLAIPVVLATELVIGLSVLLGAAPRVRDGDALASTVVREAASLAEGIVGTTRNMLAISYIED
jgi:hypothetical protein